MKYAHLIFANLRRKKLRTVLTVGSFAVALFLFGFLAVIHKAFSGNLDVVGVDRLMVINKVSIIQPLPTSYKAQIERIPGVKLVTAQTWFGGIYQDPKNFFPSFAIDPETQRQVFPELTVPDDQWNKFVGDREGAIGWYTVSLSDPDSAPRVIKAIDTQFANSPFETKSETLAAMTASWVKQAGNVEFLIMAIGGIVFFTLLLVTGN